MQHLPICTDLPASMMRAIGRVMVEYAVLELSLSRIIYDLLDVDLKAGRLAVREPRASDRLDLVFDLAELRQVSIPKADKDILRKAVLECVRQRDALAHGIWFKMPESFEYLLRDTKGQWQPEPHQRGKTKRMVKPEGKTQTSESINLTAEVIIATYRRISDLHAKIRMTLYAFP